MSAEAAAQEVQALQRLDLEGLRQAWRNRWGDPPKLRSRELMLYAAAYRLQAEAFGDMTADTRKRLADLARRFTADRNYQPTSGPSLSPGCSLVREWGGARHEVKVLTDGFSYQGQRFASLSAIAVHITGTKRSGVLFFGLKSGSAQ